MKIQHNIMAMNAYRSYTNNTSALSKNLEKLSSGYKINRAGDDAAGLAISEKMRAQITGLEAAQKNAKDGVSLVKTAEGALSEVHDMLDRMVYLATQSANGTYDDETDRDQLQKEMDQLQAEIDRIAESSNFNGIKLLDGTLGGKPSSINIDGIDAEKINAQIGVTTSVPDVIKPLGYEADGANDEKVTYGDTISYTVGLNNGTSYTASFTVEKDPDDENAAILVDVATGKKLANIPDFKPDNGISADEIGEALAKSLKYTDLADDFQIKWGDPTAGAFGFQSMNPGLTTVPQIGSLDYSVTHNGVRTATDADQPDLQGAEDEGYVIDWNDITLYDGTNRDDAIFTINGKKFVVMTGNMTGADADDNYLRAVAALGSDVTVLVSNDPDNKNGLDPADKNWEQNIAKIKELTGLTVENYSKNGVTGLKFMLGDGQAANGLRLQIGDTSDSFNYLTVSINDCHTKALGIDTVSIANRESAAVAIDRIRDAINYVSDVRGTLGATQNRLEYTQSNLSVMAENIQDAEATIRDTDVAEEMMSYVKNNILVQSAQAMLAQANQVPQGVLQLLG